MRVEKAGFINNLTAAYLETAGAVKPVAAVVSGSDVGEYPRDSGVTYDAQGKVKGGRKSTLSAPAPDGQT